MFSIVLLIVIIALLTFRAHDRYVLSPKGQHQIVFIKASIVDRWMNASMELPRLVKLYEVKTGKLVAKSDWVDVFGNGDVRWYLED